MVLGPPAYLERYNHDWQWSNSNNRYVRGDEYVAEIGRQTDRHTLHSVTEQDTNGTRQIRNRAHAGLNVSWHRDVHNIHQTHNNKQGKRTGTRKTIREWIDQVNPIPDKSKPIPDTFKPIPDTFKQSQIKGRNQQNKYETYATSESMNG